MLKKLLLDLAFWLDKHLGWHNCQREDFNGASYVGHCKYCGKKCLQDSQGNWFSIED